MDVVKSCVITSSTTMSDFSNDVSTARSTVAPDGIRPEVVVPVETLEPAALASIAMMVKDPCAIA